MTHSEFSERTNLKVTPEEFVEINNMYLLAGDLPKDDFCKDYLLHHNSQILKEYYNNSVKFSSKCNDLNSQIFSLATFLIEQSEQYSSVELRDKAIQILGLKQYLEIKLQKGYNLWQIDREDLINILQY